MTKKKLLAIIFALVALTSILGCGKLEKRNNTNVEASVPMFEVIATQNVGAYRRTIVYDTDTKVEYAFFWNSSSGKTVSTMLYMPDDTPKLYSGQKSTLVFISSEWVDSYDLSVMYDSETCVMYCCSWNSSSGDVTIQVLRSAEGTPKLFDT